MARLGNLQLRVARARLAHGLRDLAKTEAAIDAQREQRALVFGELRTQPGDLLAWESGTPRRSLRTTVSRKRNIAWRASV